MDPRAKFLQLQEWDSEEFWVRKGLPFLKSRANAPENRPKPKRKLHLNQPQWFVGVLAVSFKVIKSMHREKSFSCRLELFVSQQVVKYFSGNSKKMSKWYITILDHCSIFTSWLRKSINLQLFPKQQPFRRPAAALSLLALLVDLPEVKIRRPEKPTETHTVS